MNTCQATSQSNEIGMGVERNRSGSASIVLKASQDFTMHRLRADTRSAGGKPQRTGLPMVIQRNPRRLREGSHFPKQPQVTVSLIGSTSHADNDAAP